MSLQRRIKVFQRLQIKGIVQNQMKLQKYRLLADKFLELSLVR